MYTMPSTTRIPEPWLEEMNHHVSGDMWDAPLTARGREQAEALRPELEAYVVDLVVSDLEPNHAFLSSFYEVRP